jgi:hypothetical protein
MDSATVQQALLAQLAAIQEETAPRPPLSIFRKVLGVVLLMLALLFLVLNMIVLGHFGWGLGQNDIEKWVQMIAAGALPVMITAIHPTYVLTWRPGHWYRTHKGKAEWRRGRPNWFLLSTLTVLACVALTINFVGGIGVMSTARKAVALKAVGAEDEERRLKESRQRLEDERKAIPAHRALAAVESEIRANRLHPFWKTTKECTEVLNRNHRNYCRDYERSTGELENARQAGKLNQDISNLDGLLSNSFSRVEQQAGSGQMEALGKLSGMKADDLQVRLSLLFPILLELMTLVPMVAALYAFRVDHRALQDVPDGGFTSRPLPVALPPPADPEPPRPLRVIDAPRQEAGDVPRFMRVSGSDVIAERAVFDEFWAKRVRHQTGAQTFESDLYRHYQALCAQRSVGYLDVDTFRRLAKSLVRGMIEMNGVVIYQHVVVCEE